MNSINDLAKYFETLSASDQAEFIAEATVDCYFYQECECGFVACMQDDPGLPKKAKLADTDVQINSVNVSRDSFRI